MTTQATQQLTWKPLPDTEIKVEHVPGLAPTFTINADYSTDRQRLEGTELEQVDRLINQLTEARTALAAELATHQTRQTAG